MLRFKKKLTVSRWVPAAAILFAVLFLGVAAAADMPDTLTLTNGEILIGKLIRSSGDSVIFHSDGAGDVTIPWAKVKELTSTRTFAVIPKGVQLKDRQADGKIPRGTIHVADQQIQITSAGQPVQTVPTAGAAFVVDDDAYQRALHNPGFTEDWKGSVTGGVALVIATQKSETYTAAAHLVRAIPAEDWLAARNRTLVNFLQAYGKVHQPNTPEVKTDIFHLDAERDEYFSPRLYALGQAAFDHNFSEGLTLQQTYSGGIGWTAVKTARETLDFKATGSFISQDFTDGTTKNLIGSVFGQAFHRDISAGVKFDEQITLIPAWNKTEAISANGSAGLTVALRKSLNLNVSALNAFLNDPPAGFKKNSFQFITGVTYNIP